MADSVEVYLISNHWQWFSYRGLSPPQLHAMPGVHNMLNTKKIGTANLDVSTSSCIAALFYIIGKP